MKKVFAVFALVLLVSLAAQAQVRKGGTAWVSAKQAALKASTWFFAGARGALEMGTEVSVLQVKGNWAEVKSSGSGSLSGWTQVGNLSSRRIVASSGSRASASEVALAGKGFNQEVENAYKADGKLNYADVDKTEAITVSQEELFGFVTEGHLLTGEEQ